MRRSAVERSAPVGWVMGSGIEIAKSAGSLLLHRLVEAAAPGGEEAQRNKAARDGEDGVEDGHCDEWLDGAKQVGQAGAAAFWIPSDSPAPGGTSHPLARLPRAASAQQHDVAEQHARVVVPVAQPPERAANEEVARVGVEVEELRERERGGGADAEAGELVAEVVDEVG